MDTKTLSLIDAAREKVAKLHAIEGGLDDEPEDFSTQDMLMEIDDLLLSIRREIDPEART